MKTAFLTWIPPVFMSLSLCLIAGPVLADTHFVAPTGDVTQDGDNIQAAINAASPGDTVMLGSGTFVLGKYLEEDAAWVSTSRGSFQYFADYAWWDIRDPTINPWYWDSGGGPDTPPFPQVIVVDKPLTIEGANPPGSTVLNTVNTWLDFPFSDSLYSDANGFLIASNDVTIRNLKFYNMTYGVRVISAGSTIEGLVFDTPGHYSLLYFMDEYAAYPHLPSRKNPVKSYLRGNTWLNAIQAIHMFGSEIEVTNNFFEIRNSDSSEIPYSLWAIVFGGLPDYDDIPGVFTFSECRNNLLQNNVIQGDERSWYGAFYFSGYGPEITENTILDNTVDHMWALVESHGSAALAESNNIIGNEVLGGSLLFDISFGVFLNGANVIPLNNRFSDNTFIDVSHPMYFLGGQSNLIIGNDYSSSYTPGWASGTGSIFLSPYTNGNFVLERDFPASTTMCDQILNLGSNAIPGGGVCINNPEQAPHQDNVHAKQLEKRGMR